MRWPIVILLGAVLYWSFRERREQRQDSKEGAAACHAEMKRASEAMMSASESIAGSRATIEAQNQRISSLDSTLKALSAKLSPD